MSFAFHQRPQDPSSAPSVGTRYTNTEAFEPGGVDRKRGGSGRSLGIGYSSSRRDCGRQHSVHGEGLERAATEQRQRTTKPQAQNQQGSRSTQPEGDKEDMFVWFGIGMILSRTRKQEDKFRHRITRYNATSGGGSGQERERAAQLQPRARRGPCARVPAPCPVNASACCCEWGRRVGDAIEREPRTANGSEYSAGGVKFGGRTPAEHSTGTFGERISELWSTSNSASAWYGAGWYNYNVGPKK
ncbi:hypothetical protein C8R44DRAFT_723660 [Mycena epipterygia]|nr:hypothetical protein C8R44DRAFT_723660 [Mycena epipterygia]